MAKFSLTLMISTFPLYCEADTSFVQGIFKIKAFANARDMTLHGLSEKLHFIFIYGDYVC